MKILIANPVEESLIDGKLIKDLPDLLKKRLVGFLNEFNIKKEERSAIKKEERNAVKKEEMNTVLLLNL